MATTLIYDRDITTRMIETMLNDAKHGRIRRYFEDNAYAQAKLRHAFGQLRSTLMTDHNWHQVAVTAMQDVNRIYNTRRTGTDIEGLVCDIERVLFNYDNGDTLFDIELIDYDLLNQLAKSYINVISSYAENRQVRHPGRKLKQQLSLPSKWLHLYAPNSFAIYDSNVAKSLRTWGKYALSSCDRKRFNPNGNWHNFDPGWYRGILEFHQLILYCAESVNLRHELHDAGSNIQTLLSSIEGCSLVKITEVDIIDNHLWGANGCAVGLGIV